MSQTKALVLEMQNR